MAVSETAPKLTDTVYHVTTYEKAENILDSGLLPNPERGQEEYWSLLEQFLDKIRPQHVKDAGISRRSGVFAYPDIEVLKPRYLSTWEYSRYLRRPDEETAFGIDVDPDQVMVFEMTDLDFFPSDLSSPEATTQGLEYWNFGLSLADFRRFYQPEHDYAFSSWEIRSEYREVPGLQYRFFTPEVIVPGPIVGESVRWAASAITLLDIEEPCI